MTDQPETDLLSRLAEAIAAEADKPRAERVGFAHVMIAVVQPDLDARDAVIRRLTAELQHAQQRIAAVLALLPDDPAEDINAPFVPLRRIRAAANGQIDSAAVSGA